MTERKAAGAAGAPARRSRDQALGERLEQAIAEAERQAWDHLQRYKFFMFGYHAAAYVRLVALSGRRRPNPWGEIVKIARGQMARQGEKRN